MHPPASVLALPILLRKQAQRVQQAVQIPQPLLQPRMGGPQARQLVLLAHALLLQAALVLLQKLELLLHARVLLPQ